MPHQVPNDWGFGTVSVQLPVMVPRAGDRRRPQLQQRRHPVRLERNSAISLSSAAPKNSQQGILRPTEQHVARAQDISLSGSAALELNKSGSAEWQSKMGEVNC